MCVLDGELDFFINKHLVVFKKCVPEVVRYHDMLTHFVLLCLLSSRGFEYVLFGCVFCLFCLQSYFKLSSFLMQ